MFAVATRFHLKLYSRPKATYEHLLLSSEQIWEAAEWFSDAAETMPRNVEMTLFFVSAPPNLVDRCYLTAERSARSPRPCSPRRKMRPHECWACRKNVLTMRIASKRLLPHLRLLKTFSRFPEVCGQSSFAPKLKVCGRIHSRVTFWSRCATTSKRRPAQRRSYFLRSTPDGQREWRRTRIWLTRRRLAFMAALGRCGMTPITMRLTFDGIVGVARS